MTETEQVEINSKIRVLVDDVQDLLQELPDESTQREHIIDAASSLMEAIVKPIANRSSVGPPLKMTGKITDVAVPEIGPGNEPVKGDNR